MFASLLLVSALALVGAGAPPPGAVAHYGGADRAPDLDALERKAADAVRAAFAERPPRIDAALSRAARSLARDAALGLSFEKATRPDRLRLTLARAGATSPELAPIAIRSSDRERAIRTLRDRVTAEARVPPAAIGIGAAMRDGTFTLVALRAADRVRLDPFPIRVAPGTPHRLRGALLPPLERPSVHLISPGGAPARLPTEVHGRRFSTVIHFASPGRHTLEVLGEGPDGPEVAAILEVFAGVPIPSADEEPAADPEPADRAGKEALAAQLANELRQSRGLAPLRIDPVLTKVARDYAEELLRTGRFAHRSPTSGALADRLARAGFAYEGAGENLAQAPDVRRAHATTVASPGHLANLVDPRWSAAGFGVAIGSSAGGAPTVVLVQIFARPAR